MLIGAIISLPVQTFGVDKMKTKLICLLCILQIIFACSSPPNHELHYQKEWNAFGNGVYLRFETIPKDSMVCVRIDNVPNWINKGEPVHWNKMLPFLKGEPDAWIDKTQTMWIILTPDLDAISALAMRLEKVNTTNGSDYEMLFSIEDLTDGLQ